MCGGGGVERKRERGRQIKIERGPGREGGNEMVKEDIGKERRRTHKLGRNRGGGNPGFSFRGGAKDYVPARTLRARNQTHFRQGPVSPDEMSHG